MKHIFQMSKMGIILNCVIFIFYYMIQFGILISCLFLEFDTLSLKLHEVPFVDYVREIESGIFLSFPGTTSLLHVFAIPLLILAFLFITAIIGIFVTKRIEQDKYTSRSEALMFILFVVLFFFDKRALLGLLGSLGLMFVAKVRERGYTSVAEYSFLIGRLTLLVAIAYFLGNISYEGMSLIFTHAPEQLFVRDYVIEDMNIQIIPTAIMSGFVYVLGTATFFGNVLISWSLIRQAPQRFLRPIVIYGLFFIGFIVILMKPIFGAFFIVSAMSFFISAREYGLVPEGAYPMIQVLKKRYQKSSRQHQLELSIIDKMEMN